jgi:lipopolysaccharide heptosyltransferase II
MKKFLVIQTAFTGDAVLATALLEKLHHFFPKASIDLLVRKGNEGLFSSHPFLHDVLIWNKKTKKNQHLLQLLRKIRSKKYDVVINLQRFASTGLLTAFSGAREKIGFDKNPFSFLFTKKINHDVGNGKHEVERNQQLISYFTDADPAKPRLYPTQKNYDEIKNMVQSPFICIMPASVWFTKQYPEEKWVTFMDQLPDHYTIYLLGSPDDAALCERIQKKSTHRNTAILAGKLNFLSSAALMQKAVMNYVNDSAPLHFASATDAPVTAIFCSTVPAFGFYPLSSKSFIVETKEQLPCRPCSLHGQKSCPLQHFKCAYTIKTEQLLETLAESHE